MGHAELAKYLVERGDANVDAKDSDGSTPLINACLCRNWVVAKMLVENGAAVDVVHSLF